MSATASRGIRAGHTSGVRQVRRLALAGVLAGLLGTSVVSVTSPAVAAEVPLSEGRTAIASSAERGDLSPAVAFDGKTGTRWSSKFSDPQWLAVDLGRPTAIKKMHFVGLPARPRLERLEVSRNPCCRNPRRPLASDGRWFRIFLSSG